MPVNKVGKLLSEDAHRLWTIFNFWIQQAIAADIPEQVINLGVDETSSSKGHRYVTIGVDLDKRRVLHVTEGKGKSTINCIKKHFESKGMDPEKIKNACIDLSPSFIAGLREYFPKTSIHFDKFHVVQLLNKAMDQVRILERKEHNELKGYKYAFLKRNANLTDKKQQEISNLTTLFPTLGAAYRLKEIFFDLWSMETVEEAEGFIKHWCAEVETLKSNPFLEFVKTILGFVAVRLLQLKESFEREKIDEKVKKIPCTNILSKDVLQVLWSSTERKKPLPKKSPSLGWAYYAISKLGGWNDTKKTGKASWATIWKG